MLSARDTMPSAPCPQPARLPEPVRLPDQSWPEGTVPVVSIICYTYNHSQFIRETIEGFLTQETTFPVEIIIHDDASTDGTADIIREYESKHPSLFRNMLQKENRMSQGGDFNGPIFQHTLGEYIAMCEGDDYWTDSHKLQIQVELLEKYSQYILCGHRYQVIDEKGKFITDDSHEACFNGRTHIDVTYQNFLNPYLIQTLTVVFRKEGLHSFVNRKSASDTVIWSHLLSQGKDAIILSKAMGVYRKHSGGVYSLLSKHSHDKHGFNQLLDIAKHEGFLSEDVKWTYTELAKRIYQEQMQATQLAINELNIHVMKAINGMPPDYRFNHAEVFLSRVVGAIGRAAFLVLELRNETVNRIGEKPHWDFRKLFTLSKYATVMLLLSPLLLLYVTSMCWRRIFR